MGFKCEVCNQVQEAGTKLNKVVVAVRNVTYPVVKDSSDRIFKTPIGHEIAKELNTCFGCASKEYDVEVVGEKVLM